jgi:two-component system cell cycle response regulator CpdR
MARILVAEDDEAMRRFLAGALRRAGHDVESAADGAEAMRILEQKQFDLLLADVVMPGLDGIELARRATRGNQRLEVMFITGFAAVALRAREGLPGTPKVLSKPFHLKDLIQQIDQMVGKRGTGPVAPGPRSA